MKIFLFASLIFLIDGFAASSQLNNKLSGDSTKGLKDYYHDYFSVGVSVSPYSLKTNEAQLIVQFALNGLSINQKTLWLGPY